MALHFYSHLSYEGQRILERLDDGLRSFHGCRGNASAATSKAETNNASIADTRA
jgi:hypothetical protein